MVFGREGVRFLAASEDRLAVLRRVGKGSCGFDELLGELGVPRSSLRRHLEGFVERGWVVEQDGCFSVTWVGEVVLGWFEDLLSGFGVLEEVEPLLGFIPSGSGVGLEVLLGCEFCVADRSDPYGPVLMTEEEHVVDRGVRVMTPVLLPGFVDHFRHHVVEGGSEVELVLSSGIFDVVLEGYGEEFGEMLETGLFRVFVCREEVLFTLAVREDQVIVVFYDEEGVAKACVKNDSVEAVEWGERVYEGFREGSEVVGEGELLRD